MSRVVVDASIALAWCFPDETSGYADRVLVALEDNTILDKPEIKGFTILLENLSIVEDAQPVSDNIRSVLPLARAHGISAYDAAYLELSIRHGARLATLDRTLRNAAKARGIELFAGDTARSSFDI